MRGFIKGHIFFKGNQHGRFAALAGNERRRAVVGDFLHQLGKVVACGSVSNDFHVWSLSEDHIDQILLQGLSDAEIQVCVGVIRPLLRHQFESHPAAYIGKQLCYDDAIAKGWRKS